VKNIVQFIVLGLSSGAIYVALALGLLIIYRATALLNFAQGAMAMWGAYVYVYLRTTGKLILPIGHINMGSSKTSWWLALILGLVMGLLLSLLAQVLVFRPLRNAPPLAQVVASIALMIMLLALVQIHFNANAVPVPAILTKSSWAVAGANLNESGLILFGISIVLGVGVWAYFTYTTSGMAMRAASINERAIGLMGYSPSVLSVIAWSISAVLSTGIVILASPATSLDPVNFTFYWSPG
jgi:branched-chain amino acid transport system permease protein